MVPSVDPCPRHQLTHVLRRWVREEILRPRTLFEPASTQYRDAVSQQSGLMEVVRNENAGHWSCRSARAKFPETVL